MPPRIPTEADFAPLQTSHPSSSPTSSSPPSQTTAPPPITLIYPNPPESTTTLLILLHGLGDTHAPFAAFARNLALPGVLGIAVRGTAPLPALLTADEGGPEGTTGYHWGDDVRFSSGDGELDPDPGFERAKGWIMEQLVGEVLVRKCGWDVEDVMVFGFGQGGALALGLASSLRVPAAAEGGSSGRVEDVTEEDSKGKNKDKDKGRRFKGVVSVGGALPPSMVPSMGGLGKAATPVLVCCGRESEAVDEDAVELLEREFEQVKVVRWKRADDGMPRNREEVLPMMQFFAERLRSGWL